MTEPIVRCPTRMEIEKAGEIAFKAFGNSTLENWQRSFLGTALRFGERFILVVEVDGQLVSTVQCTPGPVYIDGESVSHSAVGSVATLPDFQKRGLAGLVMRACVRFLREEGIFLSSLWPFSYEYYRKFGWETGGEIHSYSAKSDVFTRIGDPTGVRGGTASDIPILMEVYEEWAEHLNGMTVRSEEWWRETDTLNTCYRYSKEPGTGSVIYEEHGLPYAYALYQHGSNNGSDFVLIKEMAYVNPAHRRAILAFFGTEFPDNEIEFMSPANDTFLREVSDPRSFKSSIKPGYQLRVTDPAGALENMHVDSGLSGHLNLRISDPVFEEGFEFGIKVDSGRISTRDIKTEACMEMDVQTFARLYSGYSSVDDALSLGKLSADGISTEEIALARDLFQHRNPYRSWVELG